MNALEQIIKIVDDYEKAGHALNELAQIRAIASANLLPAQHPYPLTSKTASPKSPVPLFLAVTGTPSRELSGFGFHIKLWPRWKSIVAKSTWDQAQCATVIGARGRAWLDACGFDTLYDPDATRTPWDTRTGQPKPGPNAYPLYLPGNDLNVQWGEWGLEHITVPGNACGLDIDEGHGWVPPEGGRVLVPHNVDSLQQAYLLMIVWNWFAHAIVQTAEIMA